MTTIKKISLVPNSTNSAIIGEFSEYMKKNESSENHQKNNLKAILSFAAFLGNHTWIFVLIRFSNSGDLLICYLHIHPSYNTLVEERSGEGDIFGNTSPVIDGLRLEYVRNLIENW